NGGRLGQSARDVAAMIGRGPVQSADRDRVLLDPAASTRGLARTVAGPPDNAPERVRPATEAIRIVEPPERDQPDVLGNVRVRRARPLTIDDSVEILRSLRLRRLHRDLIQSGRPVHATGRASRAAFGGIGRPLRYPVSAQACAAEFSGTAGVISRRYRQGEHQGPYGPRRETRRRAGRSRAAEEAPRPRCYVGATMRSPDRIIRQWRRVGAL